MTTQFDNVSVVKKANIYFDGKCVSHTVIVADGSRKTVGVIFPSLISQTITCVGMCLPPFSNKKGAPKPRPLPERPPRRVMEQHLARRSLAGARVQVLPP